MQPFAHLLERLLYTARPEARLALLVDHLRTVPDPDRGFGLAALKGGLRLRRVRPGVVRDLMAARTDPADLRRSCRFVGDLAETAALIWPGRKEAAAGPPLARVVEILAGAPQGVRPDLLAGWLDDLDATGRWALLQLVTGRLRAAVPAGLLRHALAVHGRVETSAVEEVWHGLEPPYAPLLAWLDGRAPRPPVRGQVPVFRPLMPAHPLAAADLPRLALAQHLAEWQWDGIRVQIAATPCGVRLFSRTGEDIGPVFPEIVAAAGGLHAVLDGELLVRPKAGTTPGDALRRRLGRKAPGPALLRACPAHVRLHDLLLEGEEDLRPLPLVARRARLEALLARSPPALMDLSPLLPVASLADLDRLRREGPGAMVRGLVLKRKDGPYGTGRPHGLWWTWRRDPHRLDLVLMYVQLGRAQRPSAPACTFGAWRTGGEGRDELVPVGRAGAEAAGVAELGRLERWVRGHTVRRYGPVREVAPGLVLEVAFDAVLRSARHKAGLTLRSPRISRIRWDTPASAAGRLQALERHDPGRAGDGRPDRGPGADLEQGHRALPAGMEAPSRGASRPRPRR